MSVTPNSFIDYVASASQDVFPIVIARISDEHLRVFKNGAILTLTTDYTISGPNVTLVVPASADDLIRIQRDTPQVTRVVDFMAGANIVESDLDNSALQMLYLSQEVWDQVLQLRDQPSVLVTWDLASPLPDVSPNSTWDEQAASRLTPALGTTLGSGQPWIIVDVANKRVNLAPGKYRIDASITVEEQSGGLSVLSAGIGNDQDGGGSVVEYSLANNQSIDVVAWVNGSYLVNVTSRLSLTFKAGMVVAGGNLFTKAPSQWVITRLGGDPELN